MSTSTASIPTPAPVAEPAREAPALRVPHGILVLGSLLLAGAAAGFGAHRRFINADGISYLDVAQVYLEGGWTAGANAYWSPLYPWMLGGVMRIAQPGPAEELFAVQFVNWCVFALALVAFIAFWSELRASDQSNEDRSLRRASMPDWAWWAAGYALFLWSALRLIKVWNTTPDLLVAAIVLGAGWLLLRMHRRPASWTLPVAFGVLLGAGYLAKAVMFPLAFVFLIAAVGAMGFRRASLLRVGVAAATFLLVAAPFVFTLSAQKGRFTFGDAGRHNYARYVNGVPDIHWQGRESGSGTPVHPTRQIVSDPPAYEFAAPVGGTYPVWYDPSHWYEGVEPRFDLRHQVGALVRTGWEYADFILLRQGPAIAIVILLLVLAGRRGVRGPGGVRSYWFLGIPPLAALALYGLVYVEPRYVAGFLILLWGTVLSAVRPPDGSTNRKLLTVGPALVAFVFAANLVAPNEKALRGLLRPPNAVAAEAWFDVGTGGAGAQLPAARALAAAGLRPGDPVAAIGYTYLAYWARLAQVRIIAEVPWPSSRRFWAADDERREETVRALFATGAVAIVAEADSGFPPPEGWTQLGETSYYLLLAPRD